jgi:cyclophilin family peptidyl-prolyl cis-trans isomerase
MPARRVLPLLLLLTALLVGACGGSSEKKPKSTATPAAAAPEDTGCEKVTKPKPKGEQHLKKPKLKLSASKTYLAQVATSCGDFEMTLDVKRAPKTSASFVYLARKHFFDGLTFHRVVSGFVIQGGDPLGNGTGGPGYSVHEAPPSDLAYSRGVVAMAKTGNEPAGTSGSQFFVVTAEDAGLPADYALLGRVTKGEDTVEEIGAVPVGPGDEPVQPVVIDSIKIVER